MSTQITFDWSQEIIIEGETFAPDCLERERYADFLASYIDGQNKNKPYVLNLNSGWGTGKTYFLKRWAHDMGTKHPVIYIDAWKEDNSNDPFMAVISAIISQLRKQTSFPDESLFYRGVEQGVKLFKQVAPLVLDVLAKKYIGESLEKLTDDNVDTGLSTQVGTAATKIATALIADHENRSKSVIALKKSIEGWIDAVTGHTGKVSPTLVIIDELDRCRPSYAVEMLEVVKHIFDIPGVFFIISTDTEQLQHAIKVVYGEGFNAQIYLSRFFDARFTLQQAPLESVINAHCNTMVFEPVFQNETKITLWPPCYEHIKNITTVMDAFEIAPRDSIQIVNRIVSILLHSPNGSVLDLIYLTTLLCLQKKDYNFYSSIVTSKQLNEMSAYYNDSSWLISSKKLRLDIHHPKIFRSEVKRVEMPLSNYYSSIFLGYLGTFKSQNPLANAVFLNKADEIISEILSSINRNGVDVALTEENIRRWFNYYYLYNDLDMVNKNKYKELVELATSFG